eukprot:358619-Chlamydomonas_euryale.AAC.16
MAGTVTGRTADKHRLAVSSTAAQRSRPLSSRREHSVHAQGLPASCSIITPNGVGPHLYTPAWQQCHRHPCQESLHAQSTPAAGARNDPNPPLLRREVEIESDAAHTSTVWTADTSSCQTKNMPWPEPSLCHEF